VLVHFEPYSEEKARQKRELEAAQRKADETKSRSKDTPPDNLPHEMIESEVDDSKALEAEDKREKK